jgi:hypothetical protein
VQVLQATWIEQFSRDGGQVRWRDKHGLPPATGWQASDDTAFDLTRFRIDNDAHHVVCPNSRPAATGSPPAAATACRSSGPTFRQPDCRPGPDRARCTRSQDNARHVTSCPAASRRPQQRIRAEQATGDWRQRYALCWASSA